MLKTVKVAVSMSSEDFKVIEEIRKRDGITRSGVVVKAVRLLRDKSEKEKMIKAYENGYKKYPEKLIEIKVIEKACIETLSDEVWE
jgi:hypothetical protein